MVKPEKPPDAKIRQTMPGEIDKYLQSQHADNLMHSIITERIKTETKLFTNLAICEAQLKSFNDDFVNNCLTGHAMMEWSDKIEKLEKAKTMIHKLINNKAKELMLEKKG